MVSFGDANFNNGNHSLSQQETLNKNGAFKKQDGLKDINKVNPKELSNEELEYIIQTGKLPAKYS